jgi:hypothetical protein
MSFTRSTFPCQGMLIGGERPRLEVKSRWGKYSRRAMRFSGAERDQLLLAIERNSLHGNSTTMWCSSSVDRSIQAQDLFTKIILQVWSAPSS